MGFCGLGYRLVRVRKKIMGKKVTTNLNKLFGSFIVMAFIQSGCFAPKYLSMDAYKKELLFKDQKSIVFFDVAEKFSNGNTMSSDYTLVKLGDPDTTYKLEAGNFFERFKAKPFNRNASRRLLILEPGIYYVDYIALTTIGSYERWLPSPGIKKDQFLYGAFEVKANEVVDMGRVLYDEPMIEHIQDIEQLKKELKEHGKEELSEKVMEGVFYPSGTQVPDIAQPINNLK